FSPDGKLLASAGHDKAVHLLDVVGRAECGQPLMCGQKLNGVAFSPDGRFLAAAGDGGDALVWVMASKRLHLKLKHPAGGGMVCFLPDGQTWATGGDDGVVRLWSVADGALRRALPGWAEGLDALAIRGDGRLLATWGFNGAARLWDLTTDPPKKQTL